jgi:site-specific recombinase XerD
MASQAKIVPFPQQAKPIKWAKTKYSNMRRYVPSGNYFAHAKVNGTLVRASLKTKSLEIAKLKLDKLLDKHRGRVKRKPGEDDSMARFAGIYLASVRASGIKQRSQDYREETWEMLKSKCSGMADMSAAAVTKETVNDWVCILKKYSPSRFNGCLETLRGIFKAAMSAGACLDDPTAEIDRAKIRIEAPKLPNNEQFETILNSLDGHGQKHGAAFTVRLLAYTGLRINEAHLLPEDIDIQTARITKNGDTRRVPIIEQARPILERLIAGEKMIDPRRALKTASSSTMTPHHLRHFFATRCIESGIDIRTVAGWLGHRDGGALLLKRYAHLRDSHSLECAGRVRV